MTLTVFRQGSKLADGRYVLERRLGAGGMATVWLATDTRLQRGVAVKLPSEALSADPTFARRFEREARTAASLSHPNLVSVYDYGSEGDRPYLISEFINGPSLAQLRETNEAPGIEALTTALLEALAHIHSSGIVHRDIKPANVLIEGNRILLTDFGIAQSTEETRLTKTGNVIGTYDYLSPEVRRGERAGPTSDLYACGILLGEQLTEDHPDRFHRLVSRLTASDAKNRPASAADALALLDEHDSATAVIPIESEPEELDETEPLERTAPTPARRPVPPRRRSPRQVLDETSTTRQRPPATISANRGVSARVLALGLLAVAALAVIGIALASGGGDDGGTNRQVTTANESNNNGQQEETTAPAETTTDTTESVPVDTTQADVPIDPAQGTALNDQGFALLQADDPEGALPLLEEAVASFPEDSTDINYAFALFNYAQALRFTGDPASAIPLLEKRLEVAPEEQVETVEAELKAVTKEARKADG